MINTPSSDNAWNQYWNNIKEKSKQLRDYIGNDFPRERDWLLTIEKSIMEALQNNNKDAAKKIVDDLSKQVDRELEERNKKERDSGISAQGGLRATVDKILRRQRPPLELTKKENLYSWNIEELIEELYSIIESYMHPVWGTFQRDQFGE
jgi:uncharacterized protein YpuA (DUF1002 family)